MFKFKLFRNKLRKQPVRRVNGQIARKIPVKEYGQVIYYLYR